MIVQARELQKGHVLQLPKEGAPAGEGTWHRVEKIKSGRVRVIAWLQGDRKVVFPVAFGLRIKGWV